MRNAIKMFFSVFTKTFSGLYEIACGFEAGARYVNQSIQLEVEAATKERKKELDQL